TAEAGRRGYSWENSPFSSVRRRTAAFAQLPHPPRRAGLLLARRGEDAARQATWAERAPTLRSPPRPVSVGGAAREPGPAVGDIEAPGGGLGIAQASKAVRREAPPDDPTPEPLARVVRVGLITVIRHACSHTAPVSGPLALFAPAVAGPVAVIAAILLGDTG